MNYLLEYLKLLTLTKDFINRIHGKKSCVITHADILKCTYATLLADQEVKEIVQKEIIISQKLHIKELILSGFRIRNFGQIL